jgi:hypothetical protein
MVRVSFSGIDKLFNGIQHEKGQFYDIFSRIVSFFHRKDYSEISNNRVGYDEKVKERYGTI